VAGGPGNYVSCPAFTPAFSFGALTWAEGGAGRSARFRTRYPTRMVYTPAHEGTVCGDSINCALPEVGVVEVETEWTVQPGGENHDWPRAFLRPENEIAMKLGKHPPGRESVQPRLAPKKKRRARTWGTIEVSRGIHGAPGWSRPSNLMCTGILPEWLRGDVINICNTHALGHLDGDQILDARRGASQWQ
jgi:hypothetical protein